MVLGFRSEIPPDMRTIFANSGTIHIFAISGLHVGILAGLLTAVLPLTRVPKPQWGWLLGPVLVLYTLLSGASASAVRACVMSLLYFGGPLFRRKPNALSSLAAAAVAILACAPLQVASLAFLFSFACVVALFVLSPIFLRLWTPDADGVDAAAPTDLAALIQDASIASGSAAPPGSRLPAWPVRCLRWTASGVRKSLAVSVAAWLASTPITAICFGRISPVAVVGNLFAIPLATGIVLCGSLSLVGGLVAEWFSTTFNCAAVALTACLVALTESTLRLPGATFEVQPWPVWSAVPWYAGCVVAALLLRLRLRRREQAAAAGDAAPSQGRREAGRIRNAEPSTAASGSRR
jgi:competence protein ComEC